MAWNQYVDTLKSYYPDNIKACGIFGHNGSTWAQENLDHAQTQYNEITDIFALYNDPSPGYANGFMLNGEKYTFLRTQDDQLLGKSKAEGKNPVCIHKTAQALVIAVGTETSQAGSINTAVGRLGEYLISQNYWFATYPIRISSIGVKYIFINI